MRDVSAALEALIRECLQYNPDTGDFSWRVKRGRCTPGAKAGHVDAKHGYVVVRIGGRLFLGQHLAWFFQTGTWPENIVDHRNRVRSDNRWVNLRPATNAQNSCNRRMRAAGFQGVHRRTSGRWRAVIRVSGKLQHLGTFDTAEEAAAAYNTAAQNHFGAFAHLNEVENATVQSPR